MATILIVDDYPPNHRLMSFVLEQSGFAVVTAYDGQQALDKLSMTSVDLVVTDLTMPKMDGLALARALRDDARYSTLPIIVVTASGKEQDYIRATGVGVDAILTKPVDSEELVREVSRLVTRGIDPHGLPSMMFTPHRLM